MENTDINEQNTKSIIDDINESITETIKKNNNSVQNVVKKENVEINNKESIVGDIEFNEHDKRDPNSSIIVV